MRTEGLGRRPFKMSSQLGLMTAISYVKQPKIRAHRRKTSSCKHTRVFSVRPPTCQGRLVIATELLQLPPLQCCMLR